MSVSLPLIRSKRGMLYATFYAKFQDVVESTTGRSEWRVPAPDPYNLDHIGDGYDVWTRGETQLLVLAVILVILTLLFAAIVALDCGRNSPIILRSGTLRDVVRHGAGRIRRNGQNGERRERHENHERRERRSGSGEGRRGNDELKAPPLSYLAPPPYVDRRESGALPV